MAKADFDIATATDEELVAALHDKELSKVYYSVLAEITRRNEKRKSTSQNVQSAEPFNPTIDISADARYIWKRIFIWFWLVPAAAGLLWFVVNLK